MERPEPVPGGWIDDRLVVRASPIEGRGLFFAEDLPAGSIVVRLGGRLVSSTELDQLIAAADADPAAPYVDTITVYADAHLVLPEGTSAHFGNHSCDPTLWHVSAYELATRRDVARGEEATVDYGTQSGVEGFAMSCRCGSSDCRGIVRGTDWHLPRVREKYLDHFVPALLDD